MLVEEMEIEARERSLQRNNSLSSDLLDHNDTFFGNADMTAEQHIESGNVERLDRTFPWFGPVLGLLRMIEEVGEVWMFQQDGAKRIFRLRVFRQSVASMSG